MGEEKHIKQCGDPNYSEITFAWDINTNCQYRCDYCYAYDMLTKNFIEKYRYVYKNVIKRLSLKTLNKFKVELVGGEPMLHPDILDIVTSLFEIKNCNYISMNTNLAKKLDDYKKFDIKECKGLEFSASFHPQYNKKINTYLDKIKEINKFKHTKLSVSMNVIDNYEYMPLYKRLVEFCNLNNISIGPNFIFSTNKFESNFSEKFLTELNCEEFSNEQIPYEFSNGEKRKYKLTEMYNENLTNFKGFNCRPKMWIITVDGVIRNRCTNEPLHILNKNINKCVKCPLKSCDIEDLYFYHKTAPGMPNPIN